MKMEYKNLVFKKEEDFYLIKINRPKKLNALNQETLSELNKCIEYIGNNTKGFYGVIITGEGEKSFVAGADIKEFIGLDDKMSKSFCENGHNVFNSIENLSIPVIGLVNGYALGGGCELSLSCHIRIATKNAKFSQPEVNLGIIPGYGGTQRLTQVIGKSRAIEMMLTAEMIDAEKALDFGLVNHIAEDYDKAYDKAKNINFAEICITSSASVIIEENLKNSIDVVAKKARGTKCPVCWKINETTCSRHPQ